MPRRLATPCSVPGCPNLDCQVHRRRADDRRPSAAARGYGRRWRRLRLMKLRASPMCQVEGCKQAATDVDHIEPKRDGGTDAWDNLQSLCHAHHSRKTATEGRGEAIPGASQA